MALIAALTFLTVVRLPWQSGPEAFRAAPGYFPVVGTVIGIALAVVDTVLRIALPVPVVSGLVLLALVGVTGGLHLDGLADTCDAFFAAGATPERRLEIMRDSYVGAHAIAGVVLLLLVQYAALAALSPPVRAGALVLMGTLSRWAMALAIALFPYARAEGLGTAFRSELSPGRIAGPAAFVLLISLFIAGPVGGALLALTFAATWAAARTLLIRLPGLTGDTYGAINEVVQAVVLVAVLGTL